jgi:acyl-CoA thioesterase-1
MLSQALIFAVMWTAAAPGRDSAPLHHSTSPRIVALGDSLTSGRGIGEVDAYPAVLQEYVDRDGLDFVVVNAGLSGATTADGLRRLQTALDGDVRILIVALGANDGLRGWPVSRLKANLSQIIETAQARGIMVVLCGMEALPVHGFDYTFDFHDAYLDLADRYHTSFVPFFLANVLGAHGLMQRDHIHPTAAGARVIARNIWPYLRQAIEEVTRGKAGRAL